MNCTEKAKVNLGQRSLRRIILLSDWSVGSSPFCKHTEIDLTPFGGKILGNFLPLLMGISKKKLVSYYKANENLYIKAKSQI